MVWAHKNKQDEFLLSLLPLLCIQVDNYWCCCCWGCCFAVWKCQSWTRAREQTPRKVVLNTPPMDPPSFFGAQGKGKSQHKTCFYYHSFPCSHHHANHPNGLQFSNYFFFFRVSSTGPSHPLNWNGLNVSRAWVVIPYHQANSAKRPAAAVQAWKAYQANHNKKAKFSGFPLSRIVENV